MKNMNIKNVYSEEAQYRYCITNLKHTENVSRQHQFNKETETQADEMTDRTEQDLILHELLKHVWIQNVTRLLISAEVVWRTEQRTTYSSDLPVLFSVWQRPVSSQMTTLILTHSPTPHYYRHTTKHADDCRSNTLAGLLVSKPVGRNGRGEGESHLATLPNVFSRVGRSVKSGQKHPAGVNLTQRNSCSNTDKDLLLWTTYQVMRFCSLSPCTER